MIEIRECARCAGLGRLYGAATSVSPRRCHECDGRGFNYVHFVPVEQAIEWAKAANETLRTALGIERAP